MTECPVCSGPSKMTWPEQWPSLEDLTAMYVAAAYRESGGNLTQAASSIGVTFNTAKRHLGRADEALKRNKWLAMSDQERSSLIRHIQRRQQLAGANNMHLGDWAEIARDENAGGSIAFDLRLHERVGRYDSATYVQSGTRPFMICSGLGFELTEAEFGGPAEHDSVCVFAQAGPRQVIATLVPKVQYDKADRYFGDLRTVALHAEGSGSHAGPDEPDDREHVRPGGAGGIQVAPAGPDGVEGEPASLGDREQMPHPEDRNVPVLDLHDESGPAGGGCRVEGGGEGGRGDVQGRVAGGAGDAGRDWRKLLRGS